MKKIFFAGTFNPFTKGHADIALRILEIADKVTIGLGVNIDKPSSAKQAEENTRLIEDWAAAHGLTERVEIVTYTTLTAEEAKKRGATCLARGVRNASDFDYEYALAAFNRDAFGIDTILIPAAPEDSFISSSAIRDLQAHGRHDLAEKYLPK